MTEKSKFEWMLIVDGLPYPELFKLKEARLTAAVLHSEGHEVHAVKRSGWFDKDDPTLKLFDALRARGIDATLKVR